MGFVFIKGKQSKHNLTAPAPPCQGLHKTCNKNTLEWVIEDHENSTLWQLIIFTIQVQILIIALGRRFSWSGNIFAKVVSLCLMEPKNVFIWKQLIGWQRSRHPPSQTDQSPNVCIVVWCVIWLIRRLGDVGLVEGGGSRELTWDWWLWLGWWPGSEPGIPTTAGDKQ